jgi:hypothetical protein
MQDLKQQMEEFRKTMPDWFKLNKQELDQLHRDMQQLKSEISRQV